MYRRSKRIKQIKQKMVILGVFILGILISMYIKSLSLKEQYISFEEKKEIEMNIRETNSIIKELKNTKKEYEDELNKYREAYNYGESSIKDLVEEKESHLKKVSGYSKVTGQGIVITVKDSDKELKDGQNPNELIVHDIDILRILNDLKKGGAKTISINGERILSNTQVKCSGATITVNNTTYGQPFIISAIGDKEDLKISIISPESYSTLLKDVYGVDIKIKENDNIIIQKVYGK